MTSRIADFIKAGKSKKLFALIDFDHTLTRYVMPDGSRGLSSHNVLQMDEETLKKRKALHDKYYKIENDPNLSKEEKIPLMEEWYIKSHLLIVEAKITKEAMEKQATASPIIFRPGVDEFFRLCNELDIFVIIMSAGLSDVVRTIMERDFPNAQYEIISNAFTYATDEPHVITGTLPPLLHPFNKSLNSASDSMREAMDGKTHALVIGDSVGDVTMASGFGCETYKFGFLNLTDEKWKPIYEDLFDHVLYGGGSDFGPINEMVGLISKGERENENGENEGAVSKYQCGETRERVKPECS